MSDNLLTNGGFEIDWGEDESHRCLIFPKDRVAYEKDVGNIFTPAGWTTWFCHAPGTWDQPEVRDARNAERVHDGEKATLLFTFCRRHDAGFFQQVQVTPGERLYLSAYAHAWSNHQGKGFPHPDDGAWSEGAGYAIMAWKEGSLPTDTGNPQEDAKYNFTFWVGIDPTGGTNPYADTVVWGEGYHVYNDFGLLEAEAVAESSTVTIFLRSKTAWAFKHNDAYWDDVMLVTVEEGYQSTMLVLPQDATREQLAEVLEDGYPYRRTFGFSHDDAGNLGGTAILYNIPEGDRQAYLDWYAERYPTVRLEWRHTSDWTESNEWDKYLLWQCYSAWRDRGFGGAGCTGTICSDGCYITNVAMAQHILGIRADATPVTVNEALGSSGYASWSPCRALWSAIKSKCGVGITDKGDLNAHLDGGGIAMIEVKPSSLEHFVLAVERRGSDYLVLDPWKNEVALLSGRYAGVESFRLLSKAADEPQYPDPGEPISLHIQQRSQGDAEFVRDVKPACVKFVLNMEWAWWVKELSPGTRTVYRQYVSNQGQYWSHPGGPKAGARAYLATFIDSLHANADAVDYVESLNETVATGDVDGIKRTVAFDVAFADALAEEGYPARPVLLTVAVGNPQHGDETRLLIPAARATVEHGGALGYHTYWGARPDYCTMNDAWQHYAGRALESWDPVFRAEGVYPRYIFGEGGAVHIGEGGGMNPGAGWRHRDCLSGYWDAYAAQILEFRRRVREWNRAHGNRAIGMTLFTCGGGSDWKYFELAGKLGALADALRANSAVTMTSLEGCG